MLIFYHTSFKKQSTIFQTFNSDIDKVSAKWGLFGKSFYNIGTAIHSTISNFNQNFQTTGSLVNSLKDTGIATWSALFPSKESIQEKMIDIKTLYPKKSDTQFSSLLDTLQNEQKIINSTNSSWSNYFKNLEQGEEWQIEFVKKTDLQKASLDDVRAATVATKALSIAGNMLAMWAISKVISWAVKGIDEFIHAAENARKTSTELTTAWSEENDILKDCITEYSDLQKKINDSSVTTEEFTSVKEELLAVQQSLIEKFGDEAKGIDLVNGKYDEQIQKLRDLDKASASEYLANNAPNITSDRIYVNQSFSGRKVNLKDV